MVRLAILLVLFLAGPASAELRLAFVVGNDAYTEVPRLQKAVNDAEALAATLAAQGYEVTLVRDADRREMNRSLSDFTARLGSGDTAFVFFAGHGVEIAGENYLLPVDIVAPDSGDGDFVASESIALSRLLDRVRATGARATIAVIDACRDNPFETTTGRSIGGTRGLGRIAAPEGTFVIFSAGAGQLALDRLSDDDPDPNSVFTRALLPRLSRPGLELRDLVSATRLEVRDLARIGNHEQFPAYYDELLGPFYLIPLSDAAARDPIGADFDLAREIGTATALEAFLDRHGDRAEDFRVMLARRMLDELADPSRAAAAPLPVAPPVAPTVAAPAAQPPAAIAEIDPRTAMRAAQTLLNALGCDAGTPDGIAGPRTRSALDRLRAANPGASLSLDTLGRRAAGGSPSSLAACPAERIAAAVPPAAVPRAVEPPAAEPPQAVEPPAATAPPVPPLSIESAVPGGLLGGWSFVLTCGSEAPLAGAMEVRRITSGEGIPVVVLLRDATGRTGSGRAELSHRRLTFSVAWSGSPGERWRANLSSDGRTFSGRTSTGCTLEGRRAN